MRRGVFHRQFNSQGSKATTAIFAQNTGEKKHTHHSTTWNISFRLVTNQDRPHIQRAACCAVICATIFLFSLNEKSFSSIEEILQRLLVTLGFPFT